MDQKNFTSIFYADDDADDLDFFKEVTSEINEPVSLFEEGQELLSTLRNPPPLASVIFLDLNMPVKSGFEVLQEIRSAPATYGIPVIILTTSSNPEDVALCKTLGASMYIKKPTSIKALKQAVNHVLSKDWKIFKANDNEFVYQQ